MRLKTIIINSLILLFFIHSPCGVKHKMETGLDDKGRYFWINDLGKLDQFDRILIRKLSNEECMWETYPNFPYRHESDYSKRFSKFYYGQKFVEASENAQVPKPLVKGEYYEIIIWVGSTGWSRLEFQH
jgi:hypothetical protein